MAMPQDLVLVRHGESEGNVVTEAAKGGDVSRYTETFMTTPGSQWRLTDTGRLQAACAGRWLRGAFELLPDDVDNVDGALFHRHYTSPYVRARETAALLDLPGARWRVNRACRERDWGDIGSIPRSQFLQAPWWRQSAALFRADPLYWVAPNGESIANVADTRVRSVLDTLHRECSGQRVEITCHGELMWAFRLVLERMSDERFAALDEDRTEKIRNGQCLHYTRRHPDTGELAGKLTWLRRATPVLTAGGEWDIDVTPWQRIDFDLPGNDELLAQVNSVPSILSPALPGPQRPAD